MVVDLFVVVVFRLFSLLLMNSVTLIIQLSNYVDLCKNRYEGLMPRDDEEQKGASRRNQKGGHIENKEHMGMGSLC